MTTFIKTEFGPFNCIFRDYESGDKQSLLHGVKLWIHLGVEKDATLDKELNSDFILSYLEETFDYTTMVSESDPQIQTFYDMDDFSMCDIRVMKEVNLRAFAEMVYRDIAPIVTENLNQKVVFVSVSDGYGNSAHYRA